MKETMIRTTSLNSRKKEKKKSGTGFHFFAEPQIFFHIQREREKLSRKIGKRPAWCKLYRQGLKKRRRQFMSKLSKALKFASAAVMCVSLAGCGGAKKAEVTKESAVTRSSARKIKVSKYTASAMGDESRKLLSYVKASVSGATVSAQTGGAYTISTRSQKAEQKLKDYINGRLNTFSKAVSAYGKGQSYTFSGEGGTISATVKKAKVSSAKVYINKGIGLLTVYRQVISATPGITVTVTDADSKSVILSRKAYSSELIK